MSLDYFYYFLLDRPVPSANMPHMNIRLTDASRSRSDANRFGGRVVSAEATYEIVNPSTAAMEQLTSAFNKNEAVSVDGKAYYLTTLNEERPVKGQSKVTLAFTSRGHGVHASAADVRLWLSTLTDRRRKLTEGQYRGVREMAAAGHSLRAIGAHFGVNKSTVSFILHPERYAAAYAGAKARAAGARVR